ncbi:MAG: hypothetical protein ACRD2C_23820 [Acidimicrobiales bacterium]
MTDEQWSSLTHFPAKRELFRRDPEFRDLWSDAKQHWGSSFRGTAMATTAVLFKPDAVVGRRLRPALSVLAAHGFVPLHVERLRLDRALVTGLWRYQWPSATVERYRLACFFLTLADSLLVLLRSPTLGLPATVRLWQLKTSPGPDGLRTKLCSLNRMLSFVHTPDEPADLLRDLGVLLDIPARRRTLAQATGPGLASADLEAAVSQLEAATAPHPLSERLSRERLAHRTGDRFITTARHHSWEDVDGWRRCVGREPEGCWDITRVASETLPLDRDDRPLVVTEDLSAAVRSWAGA